MVGTSVRLWSPPSAAQPSASIATGDRQVLSPLTQLTPVHFKHPKLFSCRPEYGCPHKPLLSNLHTEGDVETVRT